MSYTAKKLKKLKNFFGKPSNLGNPILFNSMPKAGTNLIEIIAIEAGYKRGLARCIVNDTLKWTFLRAKKGTFYLCHLPQVDYFKNPHFKSVFVERNLWECIRSYINYMFIDRNHKASSFIRNSSNPASAIESLVFSNKNPNGISLIEEYLLFNKTEEGIYDARISYDGLVNKDHQSINSLSKVLSIDAIKMELILDNSLKQDNPTKNKGKVSIFNNISLDFEESLKNKVEEFKT